MKMTNSRESRKSYAELDKSAHDVSDIRPMDAALRREWNRAKKTGAKPRAGRPRKDPRLKSRIVPISLDPTLLAQTDRFAKSAGLSRSRLVAEGLRLRMKV